jgi:hypothetical protein
MMKNTVQRLLGSALVVAAALLAIPGTFSSATGTEHTTVQAAAVTCSTQAGVGGELMCG